MFVVFVPKLNLLNAKNKNGLRDVRGSFVSTVNIPNVLLHSNVCRQARTKQNKKIGCKYVAVHQNASKAVLQSNHKAESNASNTFADHAPSQRSRFFYMKFWLCEWVLAIANETHALTVIHRFVGRFKIHKHLTVVFDFDFILYIIHAVSCTPRCRHGRFFSFISFFSTLRNGPVCVYGASQSHIVRCASIGSFVLQRHLHKYVYSGTRAQWVEAQSVYREREKKRKTRKKVLLLFLVCRKCV